MKNQIVIVNLESILKSMRDMALEHANRNIPHVQGDTIKAFDRGFYNGKADGMFFVMENIQDLIDELKKEGAK